LLILATSNVYKGLYNKQITSFFEQLKKNTIGLNKNIKFNKDSDKIKQFSAGILLRIFSQKYQNNYQHFKLNLWQLNKISLNKIQDKGINNK